MTEPLKPLLDVVVVSSQMHVYISQTDRGEFLIGAEIEPWTTYRQQGTLNFLQESSRHTLELFPQLERARMLRSWAGLCDISPDYSPILGETEVEGFLVSAGWGTYGFKAAPIVGRTMAELVATGTHPRADRAVRARALLSRPPRLRARGGGRLTLTDQRRERTDEEQPRDRPGRRAPADRRDRRAARARARGDRAVRPLQEQDLARRDRPARRPARRQADLRHRDDADEGRRGQDDDLGGAHRGHGLHRPQPGPLPARAVARARCSG